MKLIVMIPAYNEEKTIACVVKQIPRKLKEVDSLEVLLVDDGSTDNTVAKAVQAGIDEMFIHNDRAAPGMMVL